MLAFSNCVLILIIVTILTTGHANVAHPIFVVDILETQRRKKIYQKVPKAFQKCVLLVVTSLCRMLYVLVFTLIC